MEVQTAAKGWYSTEQIVAKLLEAEKLQAQDLTMTQLCKRLGISDQTFYRWRLKYGALMEGEAQRLEAFGHENAPLKQSVAEQALDISMWRTSNGETGEPGSAPGCGCYLVRRHRVPERKACRVVEESVDLHSSRPQLEGRQIDRGCRGGQAPGEVLRPAGWGACGSEARGDRPVIVSRTRGARWRGA
jgi:putative transposase